MAPPTEPVRTRSGMLPRLARTAAGGLLLIVGAALLVLPGPGLLVIAAGLAVLAVDYHWPRRLLDRVRDRLAAARRRVTPKRTGPDRNPTRAAR